MNSVVQALWHCKTVNDALAEVKELGDQALIAGDKRGADLRDSTEYQLVSHLQALFDEATQSH